MDTVDRNEGSIAGCGVVARFFFTDRRGGDGHTEGPLRSQFPRRAYHRPHQQMRSEVLLSSPQLYDIGCLSRVSDTVGGLFG